MKTETKLIKENNVEVVNTNNSNKDKLTKFLTKLNWIGFGFAITAFAVCIFEFFISVSLSIWPSNTTKNITHILNWTACGLLSTMFGIFLSIILIMKKNNMPTTTFGRPTVIVAGVCALLCVGNFFTLKYLNASIFSPFQVAPSIMIFIAYVAGKKMKAAQTL